MRESDEIKIDRYQQELSAHHNNDDIFSVDDDSCDSNREYDG